LRVCLLASGSKGNALFIESSGTRLLIDAGLSAKEICSRLARLEVDGDMLDAILVSHDHGDHCRGLGPMARKCRLPVYIHPDTLGALPNLGRIDLLHEFESGGAFTVGDLKVETVPLTHDAAHTVGFRIVGREGAVGIATDLGIATRLVRDRLQGCRVLVVETNHDEELLRDGPYPWHLKQRIRSNHGHLSNSEGAELLDALCWEGLEAVFLAHLSETNNSRQHALDEVEKVLGLQAVCQPQLIVGQQDAVSCCFVG